jgi:hypothetical protein
MRTHLTLPDLPNGAALSPCRGMWSVIVPSAATNLIINPSFEIDTTGYSAFSGSASRAASRRGVYSLEVEPAGPTGGVQYEVTLAPSTTYTWSVDVLGAAGVPYSMRVLDETFPADYLSSALEFRGTGRWERRRLSFVTRSGSSYKLTLAQNGGDSIPHFYTDGWQLCELPYDTTYLDGDQPGCAWAGARHASISSRSAGSRRGGRLLRLDDLGFTVTAEIGLGMQPADDITTPTGLLGGALYQRTVPRVRQFSLAGQFAATTFAQLQRLRAELHAALTPFGVAEQQPLVLRYTPIEGGRAIGEELEILCHYTGGLEGSTDNLYGERAAIQFAMYQPLILSVGDSGTELGATQSIPDADYIVERDASGAWHALAGGLGGGATPHVSAVVYGPDGNLYVGGKFTTAYNAAGTGSPVTVGNIAMWNGSSWAALGGFNEEVAALAFDAAGNLYAGGYFSDAAYPQLAKWDGSSWAPVGSASDATGPVFALAFDGGGRLYIGGSFANWAANANLDNVAYWDGAAWQGADAGVDDVVYTIAAVPGSTSQVIVGGDFLNAGGTPAQRLARYDAVWDSWLPLVSAAYGNDFDGEILAIAYDASNVPFVGGAFDSALTRFIAHRLSVYPDAWIWEGLNGGSGGVNGLVGSIARDPLTNAMIVGGQFTTAGGRALADRVARWTGTAWMPLDIDLPGSDAVTAIAAHPDGRLAIGSLTSGTATSSTTDTTIVNAGSAPAAPIITAMGPGSLESIVNWTSGKALYLDLDLVDGETLTIDLTPGSVSVLSSVRGNVGGSVLSGSDLASWRLLPGANTIVAKADMALRMRWRSAYTSLAGAVS